MSYDDVVAELTEAKAGVGIACDRMQTLLGELGFKVKSCKAPGHKNVTHNQLQGFFATGYNCKGGAGMVDRNYVGKILRVLAIYEVELRALTKTNK